MYKYSIIIVYNLAPTQRTNVWTEQ